MLLVLAIGYLLQENKRLSREYKAVVNRNSMAIENLVDAVLGKYANSRHIIQKNPPHGS